MAVNYTIRSTVGAFTVLGVDVSADDVYLVEFKLNTPTEAQTLYDEIISGNLELYNKGNLVVNPLGAIQKYAKTLVDINSLDTDLAEDLSCYRKLKDVEEAGVDAYKEEIKYIARKEKGNGYYEKQRRALRINKVDGAISEADGDAIYNYTEFVKLALLSGDIITASKKIDKSIADATADGATQVVIDTLNLFKADIDAMVLELY